MSEEVDFRSRGAASSAMGPTGALGQETPEGAPRGSSLPRRLFDVFFSPGKLAADVARHPRWVGALLVALALAALSTALLPPELFAEAQRRAALERGVAVPPMTERTLALIRLFSVIGAPLGFALVSFLLAGVYTFVFAFALGDEGRYRQYLALVAHAAFIPALLSLALVPLRISTGDVRLTLSVASLVPFLGDGYLTRVLSFLDLTQIWSSLVVAQGAHAIDRRRSFASGAAILIGLQIAIALVIARFAPM